MAALHTQVQSLIRDIEMSITLQLANNPDAFMKEFYAAVMADLRPFEERARVTDESPLYTPKGKLDRLRTDAAPLLRTAERAARDADQFENQLSAKHDAVIAEELAGPDPSSPAAVVDFMRQESLRQRLAAEDPIARRAFVLAAAERGAPTDKLLVRAAFEDTPPPMTMGPFGNRPGAKWQPLIDAATARDARQAIIDRRSPQGPTAWRVKELRGLATQLRRMASLGTEEEALLSA